MLAQRLRRWSNIETALGEAPVSPGAWIPGMIRMDLTGVARQLHLSLEVFS